MSDDVKPTEVRNESASAEEGESDRRKALAKIARFAAYTAPALLVMVAAEKAQAFSATE